MRLFFISPCHISSFTWHSFYFFHFHYLFTIFFTWLTQPSSNSTQSSPPAPKPSLTLPLSFSEYLLYPGITFYILVKPDLARDRVKF